MDNYYALLGVDNDAKTDEIRSAYRERKASLDNSTETGRDEARRLNKAWNVLSDPYQRGRYDEQLGSGPDGDDIEVIDDTPMRTNGKAKGATKSTRSGSRDVGPPTIKLPDGARWPAAKQRIIAMVIDLFVLLIIYAAFSFIGHAVADSQHPGAFSRIDQLNSQISGSDQKAIDAANKALSDAKKANAPNQQQLQDNVNKAKAAQSADKKALTDEQGKVGGTQTLYVGIGFLLGAVYLIVPSAITGRTLGKRLQHLKVLREDGTKLRAGDAIKRYGALVLVVYAGSITPLGVILPAIVLYAVLRWMRNNNMQGVHDRFAHTIVVSDATN
jgi:curved DNA-binding protein CbpA